jgi:hypothetical protein
LTGCSATTAAIQAACGNNKKRGKQNLNSLHDCSPFSPPKEGKFSVVADPLWAIELHKRSAVLIAEYQKYRYMSICEKSHILSKFNFDNL